MNKAIKIVQDIRNEYATGTSERMVCHRILSFLREIEREGKGTVQIVNTGNLKKRGSNALLEFT